jgi:hypothetical protein
MLLFETVEDPGASINAVHIWDGSTKIAIHDNLNISGRPNILKTFDVPGGPLVQSGIGISVRVLVHLEGPEAQPHPHRAGMQFTAAGANFF